MYTEIDRHKVFISFKYSEHHDYKDFLLNLNKRFNIFDDWSVGAGEISDNLSDEQIRKKIRDEYVSDATVLILLNGSNMRKSKFIDWELHAAMTNTDNNPKMGILVINLLDNKNGSIDSNGMVKEIFARNGYRGNWNPILSNYEQLKERYPHSPTRLLKNIIKDGVKINMIDLAELKKLPDNEMAYQIKLLVDNAFNNRKNNLYDTTDVLRRRAYE